MKASLSSVGLLPWQVESCAESFPGPVSSRELHVAFQQFAWSRVQIEAFDPLGPDSVRGAGTGSDFMITREQTAGFPAPAIEGAVFLQHCIVLL